MPGSPHGGGNTSFRLILLHCGKRSQCCVACTDEKAAGDETPQFHRVDITRNNLRTLIGCHLLLDFWPFDAASTQISPFGNVHLLKEQP